MAKPNKPGQPGEMFIDDDGVTWEWRNSNWVSVDFGPVLPVTFREHDGGAPSPGEDR
jgi:hypothetical protein